MYSFRMGVCRRCGESSRGFSTVFLHVREAGSEWEGLFARLECFIKRDVFFFFLFFFLGRGSLEKAVG